MTENNAGVKEYLEYWYLYSPKVDGILRVESIRGSFPKFQDKIVHVVLSEEYETLQKKYDDLEKQTMCCPACGEEVSIDQKIRLSHDMQKKDAEIARLRAALHKYGYEFIHNPESNDKSKQYWTDKGIHDHGAIARDALKD